MMAPMFMWPLNLFFANADVIETLYPGLDTDNYDEAIAAAAQDFINASDIV